MSMSFKSKGANAAKLALSAVLTLTLFSVPIVAIADDDAAAESDTVAEEATSSEEAASDSAQSPSVQHGLQAAASETAFSNEATISASAEGACGLYAEKGATIIANALDVQTQGNRGTAVATSDEGGNISLANSALSTAGTDAPLLLSAGVVEVDNVSGSAAQSQIARIRDTGELIVVDSAFESSATQAATDESIAGAVTLYQTSGNDATTATSATALFQASNTSMKSALKSGAFFHLANTAATITVSGCNLDFDTDKVKLLVAAGSDAASDLASTTKKEASAFGTPGKNGVTATFTALGQKLAGDIEVDSISSVDLYLLEGSKWTGSASITSNTAGTALDNNIIVNIDATSSWVVTENATVSKLNIAKGGALVDEKGKAVTIVDADGNKLVDGASDITVAVTDEFATTVKTSEANKLKGSTIDRTAFDEENGTSTAFGTNGADTSAADEERAAALQAIITEWFHNF